MVFQERTYSVLLVSASAKFNTAIMPLLPVTDYWPVSVAKSVAEARRFLLDSPCDIVVINSPLPDDSGMGLAMDLCAASGAGVLLLVKGVVTLQKPTSLQMVSQSLRVLCATRERLRQLEAKQVTVQEKIEEIRLVNRAKWLLIENLHLAEPDAHRYVEKQAMDLRISKREAAECIIQSYQP